MYLNLLDTVEVTVFFHNGLVLVPIMLGKYLKQKNWVFFYLKGKYIF